MKICPTCDQTVAEEVMRCPACGSEIGGGRTHIDDYRIIKVLHDSNASLFCKAVHETSGETVMIRLFSARSGVNRTVAKRLKRALKKQQKLPIEGFLHHQAIQQSSDGLWYRVSDWVESDSWGSLLASGTLTALHTKLDLFHQIATILSTLHRQGEIIPHLILNDIMVARDAQGVLQAVIDYKLSRFLDPGMEKPGPMLQQLLDRHPDMTNRRPLDTRSDIWSLGKVFVEILAGDLQIENHEAAVDELDVPDTLKVLLRVMLADDPDLRPQSMQEIAVALRTIRQEYCAERAAKAFTSRPPQRSSLRRLQLRFRWLTAVVILLALASVTTWYINRPQEEVGAVLEGYANQYVQSIAFVLVDYRLVSDGKTVYRGNAEGTAFLVDEAGYLLTSRHVVCPWLEDTDLLSKASQLLDEGTVPQLNYRIYLWFEGETAFNRSGHVIENPEIADFYFTDNAFSTAAPARLRIMGVVRLPTRVRQLIASPLKDDIAVLQIDQVPEGLAPLPLDQHLDTNEILRLAPVIALGFPLGSSIQADTVNVSAVDGHVRRSFRNMLQIDSSIHGGNSGGPLIDANGNVIGIVSAVALERSASIYDSARPLGDIGMILPITGAVELLAKIKSGQLTWNGVLDFSLPSTLEEIAETALAGRWDDARARAEQALEGSRQAELFMASGMLAFCDGDLAAARQRFAEALSIVPDDGQAMLMLYIVDWLSGNAALNAQRDQLLRADWRSPIEFEGHLVRMLDRGATLESNEPELEMWNNRTEKSWLYFTAALLMLEADRPSEAIELLGDALLAAEFGDWSLHLAMAQLEKLLVEQDQNRLDEFRGIASTSPAALKTLQSRMATVLSAHPSSGTDTAERLALLEDVREIQPDNFDLIAALALTYTADENWPAALTHIRDYLAREQRPNATRLSLGLIEAGVLRSQRMNVEAESTLLEYNSLIQDDLYLKLGDFMLGRMEAKTILAEAEGRPEDLLIAATLIGFWEDATGNRDNALAHYKDALGTFMDDWLEFNFARARIKRLRQPRD
jgi:S1-C subfamily serine protease